MNTVKSLQSELFSLQKVVLDLIRTMNIAFFHVQSEYTLININTKWEEDMMVKDHSHRH